MRAGRVNMARKQEYGNESITSLKGADRVRKRPAVIQAEAYWVAHRPRPFRPSLNS